LKSKGKSTQDRAEDRKKAMRERKAAREAQKMFENMSDEERGKLQEVMTNEWDKASEVYTDFQKAAEANMFLEALAKDPAFTKFCGDNYILGINTETGAKSIIKKDTEEVLISYMTDVIPDESSGELIFTTVQLDVPQNDSLSEPSSE